MQDGRKKTRPTLGSAIDDLGFSPSEALEIEVKAEIYRDLLQYIQERGFAQQELGSVLGIHRPDVSNPLNGRVSKFGVGAMGGEKPYSPANAANVAPLTRMMRHSTSISAPMAS